MSPYSIVGVRFIEPARAFRTMLKVKCYSDYKANQRPISFSINNREFLVKEIIDQWYSPGCLYFKVRDEDNHTYILKYVQDRDLWELEFFKKEKE